MVNTIISAAVATAVILGIMAVGQIKTDAVFATSSCVAAEAKLAGYPEPYSEKAWELFAPQCVR